MGGEELKYVLALLRLRGVSQSAALKLYDRFGTARAVFENRTEVDGKLGTSLSDWTEVLNWAEREMDFCEKNKIQIITRHDPDYPARLNACADAPLAIFYRGSANLNAKHIISIVGTRKITEYGRTICQTFLRDLQALVPECLVVSGLAYGVDIQAHRACLEASLPTVGVLAHGLDRIYPAMHRATAAEMVSHGGLLTEYPTMTIPDKGNFIRRNRIVAGLSEATIVVESANHGGALITANLAIGYGRNVFAFPGRVFDTYSEGCNKLLQTGKAMLATSAQDLVSALGWQTATQAAQPVQRELFPQLSPLQQGIADTLKDHDDCSINQLAGFLSTTISEITNALFELEMKGVVKFLPGGRYKIIPT